MYYLKLFDENLVSFDMRNDFGLNIMKYSVLFINLLKIKYFLS